MKGSLSSLVILLAGMMLLSAIIPVSAAVYSPTGAGISTVGTGGDYATLGDAIAAITAAGTRDASQWVLEIVSNTSEPINMSLVCTIAPGGSILIRPAAATQPVVTFMATTDNSGPSGHLVIGSATASWTISPTNGVVIDGSNNGTNTRDLTFQNQAVTGHTFASIITVAGNSDNVIIRNCKIINLFTNTGSSMSCIRIAPRWVSASEYYIPRDTQIINNELQVLTNQGHGINVAGSGTVVAGQSPSGIVVRGNDITARIRGVFFNPAYGWLVENNNIVTTGNTAFDTFGVFQNSTNTPPAYTSIVRNNRIVVTNPSTGTAVNGPTGIFLGTSGAGYDRVIEVYNNMITLLDIGARNAGINVNIRGIATTSGITTRIYNNSIYIANNPAAAGDPTGAAAYGIGGYAAAAYNSTVMNNIIAIEEGNVPCISQNLLPSGAGSGFACDNNNLYVSGGALTGRITTTTYATLALWQGAGFDLNGKNLSPLPPVWVSTTDLHFNGDPGSAWKFGADVSGIPGLAKDIDGADRDVIVPYVGADSPVAPDRTLTIASAYGSPIPVVGVHNTTSNTLVNASVNSPISLAPGSRVTCTGYTGTGDAGSGATTAVSFTLLSNSSITWNWQQQYQLSVAINPPGAGTVTPADGSWHDANAVIAVQAFENTGWAFDSWSGDLTGSVNPSNLTMDAPKSVTANFVRAPYAEGANFKIFAGPKADVYDQAEALLEVAVSSTDLIQGVTGAITAGGFHPATVGGAANLTNGTFDASGLTVIAQDNQAPNPSLVLEYDFSAGGEVADVTGIRIFSGHDGSGGSRVFINVKVEVDSGFGYTELGNLSTGSFGLAAPGGSDSAVAYVEWSGSASDVEKIRFTFENVSHNSTGFFQAPDDNTTNPPLNYPNQGTVLKEIDLFGTKSLSVREWDLY